MDSWAEDSDESDSSSDELAIPEELKQKLKLKQEKITFAERCPIRTIRQTLLYH